MGRGTGLAPGLMANTERRRTLGLWRVRALGSKQCSALSDSYGDPGGQGPIGHLDRYTN